MTLPATCGGAAVDLTAFVPQATFGELVLSGATDADGVFSFPFVAPGTYTLGYASEVEFDNGETLEFTAAPSVTTATIASGGSATADYTITAASCVAAG